MANIVIIYYKILGLTTSLTEPTGDCIKAFFQISVLPIISNNWIRLKTILARRKSDFDNVLEVPGQFFIFLSH